MNVALFYCFYPGRLFRVEYRSSPSRMRHILDRMLFKTPTRRNFGKGRVTDILRFDAQVSGPGLDILSCILLWCVLVVPLDLMKSPRLCPTRFSDDLKGLLSSSPCIGRCLFMLRIRISPEYLHVLTLFVTIYAELFELHSKGGLEVSFGPHSGPAARKI